MDHQSTPVGGEQMLASVHFRGRNRRKVKESRDYHQDIDVGVTQCTCSISSIASDSCTRLRRRQLRTAVRDGDVVLLRRLLLQICRFSEKGEVSDDVINESVSDTFSYSLLTLAVRCGHLDVVDTLVSSSRCDVDRLSRTGISALDEALGAWFRGLEQSHCRPRKIRAGEPDEERSVGKANDSSVCGSNTSARVRHDNARRYRIVRRLLNVGASHVTPEALDKIVKAAEIRGASGRADIWSLVKVVCEQGSLHVRSILLAVLTWYPDTVAMLSVLLHCSANPIYVVRSTCQSSTPSAISSAAHRPLPLENAAILVRSCSDPSLLNLVDSTTSNRNVLIQHTSTFPLLSNGRPIDDRQMSGVDSTSWPEYRVLVELLTLSGHRVGLNVLDSLYRRHAALYRWVVEHGGCGSGLQKYPTSLLHAARLTVRRQMSPNVVAALPELAGVLPPSLRDFLVFSEVSAS